MSGQTPTIPPTTTRGNYKEELGTMADGIGEIAESGKMFLGSPSQPIDLDKVESQHPMSLEFARAMSQGALNMIRARDAGQTLTASDASSTYFKDALKLLPRMSLEDIQVGYAVLGRDAKEMGAAYRAMSSTAAPTHGGSGPLARMLSAAAKP